MKHFKFLGLGFLLLTACHKNYPKELAQAETAYAEKNYINVIDTLNRALPDWKESDGTEKKGRGYELLGNSYHQLRNPEKAIEAYNQAVQASDTAHAAAYAVGNLYLLKNQPENARKNFEAALRMKPNDPLYLLGLGNSYFALKNNAQAMAAFTKVLDVSPGVHEALESMAAIRSSASRNKPVAKKTDRKPKITVHKKR